MNRFVRCFVMWLLVLALPVQGFAASTMLHCGTEHHGAMQATDSGHHHAGHKQMGAQGVSAGSESTHHDHAAGAAPAHEDSASGTLTAKHANAMGKCSSCAACCSVAFLPATVIAFTAPVPSRVLPVVELTAHVGFFTDGPDRPPRLPLA